MNPNIEQSNTNLITRLSEIPDGSPSKVGFDIDKFKKEVEAVNRDINQFSEFAKEYKNKDFVEKFFTLGTTEQIITATDAIARLGRLTLELQAVTSVIAAEIHSNTNRLNAQQNKINEQQDGLEEQGRIVSGIPLQLKELLERVNGIRSQLRVQIGDDLEALRKELHQESANLRTNFLASMSAQQELYQGKINKLAITIGILALSQFGLITYFVLR